MIDVGLHRMKSTSTKNLTFPDIVHLVVRFIVCVNPGHLHLLMHHHLIPLNQQSEVMLHISKRLDRPTLSPFLVAQAQSQMLIQRDLLKKKLMNKNWQMLG